LICGTSTGGLIALLLAKKKMSIEEAIQVYQNLGPLIFQDERGFMAAIGRGERFDSGIVAKAVTDIVGEELMLAEDDADEGLSCRVSQLTCLLAHQEFNLLSVLCDCPKQRHFSCS
jgi:hypothetical protein